MERITYRHAEFSNRFNRLSRRYCSVDSTAIRRMVDESKNLEELGRGSARVVYALSSRFALKLALNAKGVAQNQAEVEVFNKASRSRAIAQVFRYDPDYEWIVSELARHVSDIEFEQYFGMEFYAMTYHLMAEWGMRRFQTKLPTWSPKWTEVRQCVRDVVILAAETGTGVGDFNQLEQWGRVPDGRIVLIDYGYTKPVALKHYGYWD